ncbi:hypothetical protein CRE_20448 [Caenorhabditis remanei]|uniref:Uncharacterized protein n=1 Tax=Caenorhabditis remanei TaxID=31234 RepID=E3N2R9_CAERE|nr:hypothetical protein CRE_20448 [Caenorhabditis remanei]
MNFRIANSSIYFFPIFLLNYQSDFNFFSFFLLIFELILYVIAGIMTVNGCLVIHKTRVFHQNMNICLCSFLMQWFELLVGKLLVMPYQKGWMVVPGNDPSRTFADLYTKNASRMAVITSFWDCPLFVIGMFLISHYIVCAILSLVVLTVERSFATYLLNDYETKTVPEIHRILLVAQQIIGALISWLSCTVMIPVEAWLILIVLVMALTFAGYTYIWYWNVRVHKIMDSRHIFSCTKYSLQARFQAKENARSLSFARTVFSLATVCISSQAIILAVQTPELLGNLAVPFFYLLELTHTAYPILFIPLILLTVPSWRKKFFDGCVTIRLIKWFLAKRSPEVGFMKPRSDSKLETDEYFKQLNRLWT